MNKSFDNIVSGVLHDYITGISGLECLVGLNNDTQALECEGSWQAVQDRMQQQLGDQWQQTKVENHCELLSYYYLICFRVAGQSDRAAGRAGGEATGDIR